MFNTHNFTKNQKGKLAKKAEFAAELLKDNRHQQPPSSPTKIESGLNGVLKMGESVKLGLNRLNQNWNHLEKETQLLFDSHQKELQKEIQTLRLEINQLAKATENLEHQVEIAASQPVVDISEYQIGFLGHLKNFIKGFRQNISQASLWLETFQTKKKKKNCFWSQVKNKKGGGEQYLFSSEHSAARSAT